MFCGSMVYLSLSLWEKKVGLNFLSPLKQKNQKQQQKLESTL